MEASPLLSDRLAALKTKKTELIDLYTTAIESFEQQLHARVDRLSDELKHFATEQIADDSVIISIEREIKIISGLEDRIKSTQKILSQFVERSKYLFRDDIIPTNGKYGVIADLRGAMASEATEEETEEVMVETLGA